MQVIKNNPYRTIGLLAGASLKDQTRQANRLKQFVEAEQEVTDDFSFPVFGNVNRTVNSIGDAVSKLNLNNDRMNAALFWFYNGSHIDEASFDNLKDNNLQEAINIWERRTSGEVSHSNHSAFQNLSTLKLLTAFNNGTINSTTLEEGIYLKLKFLESDFVHEFKEKIADETYRTNKNELELYFLNQVQNEVEKNTSISSQNLIEIINKQTFSAKEEFLGKFIQKPIEQIERMIEASKAKRKIKKDVIIAGDTLYKEARPLLETLKSAIGTSNLKFQTICDKVSDEILQCGIQLFNDFRDSSSYDPGDSAMKLFTKAKALAIGKVAKERCRENTEGVQEWINDKPERDKQSKVIKDFEILKNLIDEYDRYTETIGNAKNLLSRAKPHLFNVKQILGATDELYLGLSSRIASDAQGMMVAEINALQATFGKAYDNASKLASVLLLKQKVEEAWDVTNTIGSMDLREDFKSRFNTNRTSLSNLKTQLANVGRNTGRSTGSGGCYIATMVYGNYDHPQVLVLRKFRDDVLDKYIIGKWFIRNYYKYSPGMVNKLKNKKMINDVIRKLLNQFIKLIKIR